jgi:hypothetical protein
MDIYDYIAIAILLLIIFVVYRKNKEHLTVGTEPVLNIAKIYADATGTVTFNNINNIAKIITTDLSANNISNNKLRVIDISANNINSDNISNNKLIVTDISANNITISSELNAPNDKNYIWAVGAGNEKLYRCLLPCSTGQWENINGSGITKVSVGKDNIFVVTNTNLLYKCKKPCDTGVWTQITGSVVEIAADNFI